MSARFSGSGCFVHDLFHGGEETQRIFDTYYRELCRRIGGGYSYFQFTEDIRIAVMEGLFFPLKLYVHEGVRDEELVYKSLTAYKQLLSS